jgi:hypothetical protein
MTCDLLAPKAHLDYFACYDSILSKSSWKIQLNLTKDAGAGKRVCAGVHEDICLYVVSL